MIIYSKKYDGAALSQRLALKFFMKWIPDTHPTSHWTDSGHGKNVKQLKILANNSFN